MRRRLGKRQNQQVHNRRAAEYACQDRQGRRTEYQGVAAQMPDRIKPSRNGGGADGIARQQGTAQTGAKPETSPVARHGIFCARCRGIGFKRRGLEGKTGGAQNCLNAV
ncbi:hypothetical protein [Neisseria meningitidis]|uniref:hypothetical protein n=1 Tax=Neisseria meningitidis TaxID=487 RepID=UPI001F52228F|nr:hypothetical protein [Neisseria meningitidis]